MLDPFVGSGGCLIAAAHHGGICFGSDMDRRMLNGWGCVYKNPRQVKTDSLDIFSNFKSYDLPLPGILAATVQRSVCCVSFSAGLRNRGWISSLQILHMVKFH